MNVPRSVLKGYNSRLFCGTFMILTDKTLISQSTFALLHRDDVDLEYEIYKGPGYQFYSARSSGRVVTLKVYEGSHSKEVSIITRSNSDWHSS